MKSYDYMKRKGVRPVEWEEFYYLCAGLAAAAADFDPEVIVGLARGGLYPATQIAHMLRKNLIPLAISRRDNDVVVNDDPQWQLKPPSSLTGKRILLVDDISDTGATLNVARQLIESSSNEVKTAALFAHTHGTEAVNYVGLVSDELIINPWDRNVVQDGKLVLNSEYAQALKGLGTSVPDLAEKQIPKIDKFDK